MTVLNSSQEIEMLKSSGRILSNLFKALKKLIKPGVSTKYLDEFSYNFIKKHGAEPAFLGYRGYPASICVSLNEEIVHGIPSGRVLNEGDIVSIDAGVKFADFYTDSAWTFILGRVSRKAKMLVKVAKEALYRGIKQARAGNFVGDISWAIQEFVESKGFKVIRDFVGHGVGNLLHDEPQVPNFGRPHEGLRLREGLVLAIEPMVSMGDWRVEILSNGWTARTKDGSLSSHFEHTIVVGRKKALVITQ